MNLLAIETSTEYCSVAVVRGDALFDRHELAGQRHSEMLLPMVDAVLAEAGLRVADIEGIAYGAGPGSFTGLRIACGVTQGLALARGVGVVGVATLLALAEEAAHAEARANVDRVIACLDARMGEVYHAAYRKTDGRWEEETGPSLHAPDAVPHVSGDGWLGCGSGFAAHGERLALRYGAALAGVRPHAAPTARAIVRLARPEFEAGRARDAASAAPVYLRDKVALKTSERV